MDYNHVTLLGRLTRDPELSYLSSGTAMTKFGLAIGEKYKKDDQWVEKTEFVDLVAWGKQGELVNEYLTKGSVCLVDGRLNFEQWETKDGQKRSKLSVTANKVVFLGGKSEKPTTQSKEDDSIPF